VKGINARNGDCAGMSSVRGFDRDCGVLARRAGALLGVSRSPLGLRAVLKLTPETASTLRSSNLEGLGGAISNGFFNGKFRDECLSREWLKSTNDAKMLIDSWSWRCNKIRPRSSLVRRTPHEFKRRLRIQGPNEALFWNRCKGTSQQPSLLRWQA
jgi:hypothetical protein